MGKTFKDKMKRQGGKKFKKGLEVKTSSGSDTDSRKVDLAKGFSKRGKK